jgi:hypothetical protein
LLNVGRQSGSDMTRAIRVPGFRLKGGKVEKDPKRLDVSARLRQRGSKKVRPARRVVR